MSLHHFHWDGKERIVSIDKTVKGQLTLQFLDAEISASAAAKLTVVLSKPLYASLATLDISRQERVADILESLELQVGLINVHI